MAFLYGGAFLLNYVFADQYGSGRDGVFGWGRLIVGMLSGVGLFGFIVLMQTRLRVKRRAGLPFGLLIAALFLLARCRKLYATARWFLCAITVKVTTMWQPLSIILMVRVRVVLLNDWERMTPLYYHAVGRRTGRMSGYLADIRSRRPKPWIDHVYENLPGRPCLIQWLPRRNPWRRVFCGPFYQVVEPGDTAIPPELTLVSAAIDDFELAAFCSA